MRVLRPSVSLTTRRCWWPWQATCGRCVTHRTCAPVAQAAQLAADDLGHRAADARVDFVEHHARRGGARAAHLHGQRQARQLAAGGDLRDRARRLAGVGADAEFHPVGAVRRRLGALQRRHVDHKLPAGHAQLLHAAGDCGGQRARRAGARDRELARLLLIGARARWPAARAGIQGRRRRLSMLRQLALQRAVPGDADRRARRGACGPAPRSSRAAARPSPGAPDRTPAIPGSAQSECATSCTWRAASSMAGCSAASRASRAPAVRNALPRARQQLVRVALLGFVQRPRARARALCASLPLWAMRVRSSCSAANLALGQAQRVQFLHLVAQQIEPRMAVAGRPPRAVTLRFISASQAACAARTSPTSDSSWPNSSSSSRCEWLRISD